MLSKHAEGNISDLPSWVLGSRNIVIGVTEDSEGIVLKVTPCEGFDQDIVSMRLIKSVDDVNTIISPMSFSGPLPNKNVENDFILYGDPSVVEENNSLAVPALNDRYLIGWGRKSGFFNIFGIEQAKTDAIVLWNCAKEKIGIGKGKSFIQEVQNIFLKFQAIIKRKAFLERRIHRFIYQYRRFLLPSHKRCLFEHELYFGNEKRKADFILEREEGFPPLLVELESPIHKVLTRSNDLTAPANHARKQIAEWISYIEKDSLRNASGEYSFLTGCKEKLVIIGKGLENRDRLIETKFDGVLFWTYDMLLNEAKIRLNKQIASQYSILGLKAIEPF